MIAILQRIKWWFKKSPEPKVGQVWEFRHYGNHYPTIGKIVKLQYNNVYMYTPSGRAVDYPRDYLMQDATRMIKDV